MSYSYSSYSYDDYSYSDYYDYSDQRNQSYSETYSDYKTVSSGYYDEEYYSYSDSKRSSADPSDYYDYSKTGESYTGDYSYTPTYTKTDDNTQTRRKNEDSSYYYSDQSASGTRTYSGEYDSEYYSQYTRTSEGYYSQSSPYYYSSTEYDYDDDYTQDSYYDEDYSKGKSDSYYYDDTYDRDTSRKKDSGYSKSDDYYYSSSYTVDSTESVTKSTSSTTSSYSNETESSSSVASVGVTQVKLNRELVTLRTPTKEFPSIPVAPKRCFLKMFSGEDMIHRFVHQLFIFQREYETARLNKTPTVLIAEESSSAALTKAEKKKAKKEKKSKEHKGRNQPPTKEEPVVTSLTPEGLYSQRSVRIAFNCIGLSSLERKEVLKNVPTPVPQITLTQILNMCNAAHVKELVAKKFLALDTHRTGELELSIVCDTLRTLGIASSPILQDVRINIADSLADKKPAMCMTVERLIGDDKEGSVQWETTKIPVLQILKKAREAKRATSVQLHDGHVFMGDDALFRFTGDTNVFQRIKTYIEAATYVCVLTEIFTVYDSLGNAHVLYPHLVRSLLLPRPPPQQPLKGEEAERKVIYIENLFRSVYTPMEKLDTYANTKGIFMYAGKAATESTLHNTQDSEEKRRRNVVPNTTDDLLRFDLGKTTHSTSVTFAIEKVRLPEEVEEGAHCFCYVSTITPQNVFLPAVKVPVTSIRNSTKEGYTWTFKTKDKKDETLLFGGPHDRLYVECCFELPGETSSPPTTWCAGYAVVELEGLKTSTLPVHQGSLLNLESDAPPAEEEKKGKKSFLSKLKKEKKPAGQTATSIKIKVVKTKGEPEYLSNMPKRYLVKSRHAQLISDLRGAIIELGKECAYAGQALRQQVVLRIFSVAANDELLDQLELFLRHHAKHYSKEESKSGEGRCRDLLLGVTSFAALFNCSDEVSSFAQTLIKKKPLEDAFSENTMMRCISI